LGFLKSSRHMAGNFVELGHCRFIPIPFLFIICQYQSELLTSSLNKIQAFNTYISADHLSQNSARNFR
jgi:hypothetical protein